jgi:hypothetical protein
VTQLQNVVTCHFSWRPSVRSSILGGVVICDSGASVVVGIDMVDEVESTGEAEVGEEAGVRGTKVDANVAGTQMARENRERNCRILLYKWD